MPNFMLLPHFAENLDILPLITVKQAGAKALLIPSRITQAINMSGYIFEINTLSGKLNETNNALRIRSSTD